MAITQDHGSAHENLGHGWRHGAAGDAGNHTVSAMAADSFILACTEIPLFLPYWTDPRPVVDATDAAVAFALAP